MALQLQFCKMSFVHAELSHPVALFQLDDWLAPWQGLPLEDASVRMSWLMEGGAGPQDRPQNCCAREIRLRS